jgi:hypothetical protein
MVCGKEKPKAVRRRAGFDEVIRIQKGVRLGGIRGARYSAVRIQSSETVVFYYCGFWPIKSRQVSKTKKSIGQF